MKRICLTVVGLYIGLLAAFSQATPADTSQYKSRKLTLDEANFVSSYYQQDGNHSAVMGGIGSQKLTDLSTSIDVKLKNWDSHNRKQTWDFELGVDHYTSASSDMIDLKNNSSASYSDTRIYPALSWARENEVKGTTIGAGISFSNEYDYQSFGGNLSFSKKTGDKSGELFIKGQVYLDQLKVILPIELRPVPAGGIYDRKQTYPTSARNSYSTSLSYSQIINQRLQVMFLIDLIYQKGYLGLPFYRVYFDDNSVHAENLPSARLKIPIGFRANYFLGDRFIIRSYYRYYHDDWGLNAHTFELETPVKITPFLSVSPFYRFYSQTAVNYFAPYQAHTINDRFYTSNFDLSAFNSHFFGAGVRLIPPKGVFGIQHFNMLEIRYGHYAKSDAMHADILSLNLKFK